MHYSDRSISPSGQTVGPIANPALTSGSFVQCPAALLQGMSDEQLCELSSLYQQAYEQALKSVQVQAIHKRRFQVPDEALRSIGWN